MRENKYRIDIAAIASDVVAGATVGWNELSVFGGEFDAGEVGSFFDAWRTVASDMSYRIWENIDCMFFENGTWPDKYALFEQARLFGDGGDLSVRRDGDRCFWRFVGPEGYRLPAGVQGYDYWGSVPEGTRLHVALDEVLLWGKGEKMPDGSMIWRDDRTAGHRLVYPQQTAERVKLVMKKYSRAGNVEHVRYLRLEGWK